MATQKSLLADLAETIARHQPQSPASKAPSWLRWVGRQIFPNLGSVLLMLILLSTFPGLAASLNNINAASISTIPYQGRLADASGNPITGKQNMEFRLYNTPTSGTPLWEEFWTGANSVDVSDGLFSVMLGSLNTGLTAVVQGNTNLYLGITVGTDSEMAPRVQLGSVPFSIWSLTVADDSITTAKISDGAVTRDKLAADAVAQPMQWGNIILSASPPNYPTSYEWVDVQELQAVVQVEHPSVVFVAGHAFVNSDSTAICDMRVVIGDNYGADTRYQGHFWHTVPLDHVALVQPGTHTIKVQVRAYPGAPLTGDGVLGYATSLSYFVQPQP